MTKKTLPALLDILPYALLLLGRYLFALVFEQGVINPAAFVIQFVISVFLFQLLACFQNTVFAALSTLALESLLIQSNQIKMAVSGEPIVARDIQQFWQATELSGYASIGVYISLFALLIFTFLGWRYRSRGLRPLFERLPLTLPLLVFIWAYAFGNSSLARQSRDMLCELGVCYYAWTPAGNANLNGILAHLVMTTEALQVPQKADHHFYDTRLAFKTNPDSPDVVLILCESCFTTLDDKFRTPMLGLQELGLQPFYMLSPVYGGNTPEAEFEVLTGLSAAVFPGVDYQNFSDSYRAESATLIKRFNDAGYKTINLHNFKGEFWKRKDVHKKFGFKQLKFIEDMDPDKSTWGNMQRDDAIIYDNALQFYTDLDPNEKAFIYLITIHTHGDYLEQDNDHGEHDYLARLAESMDSMKGFINAMQAQAQAKGRALAIIVYGDHKPALTRVLRAHKILNSALFRDQPAGDAQSTSFVLNPSYALWKERARTSVFLKLPDEINSKSLALRLDDKPLFCLGSEISALVKGTDDAFWESVNAICNQPQEPFLSKTSNPWTDFFPQAIYAERLF